MVEYGEKLLILDTKYKEISRFEGNANYAESINNEVKQADLYQMVTYAWKRAVKDVYLLYPMFRFEEPESTFPYAVCESPAGSINIHFIRMPFIFEEDEEKTKQQLTGVIKSIFGID